MVADESEYTSTIRSSVDKMLIATKTTKLSRLGIHLSAEVEMTPGFGLFLTELLYRQGISIRHAYIGEEMVLILGRDDDPRAYETLGQEIDKAAASPANDAISSTQGTEGPAHTMRLGRGCGRRT